MSDELHVDDVQPSEAINAQSPHHATGKILALYYSMLFNNNFKA